MASHAFERIRIDRLIRRLTLRTQCESVTRIHDRVFFPAHFIPGIFLILVGYVGCDLLLANIFLVFALGFNGAASISNLSNNQDLSPNFAGFLYGIMNTIGCTSGMIIPPLVEVIAGRYGVSITSKLELYLLNESLNYP